MSVLAIRLSLLLALLIISPVIGLGQDLEARLKEIDDYAAKTGLDWKIPGFAVAIVKDDKVVFAKGYGVRELNKPATVDADTLFAIASNSKAFTAAALAILVDEGKLIWHFDSFRVKWRDSIVYPFPRGFVSFIIDNKGKVSEMKIDVANQDFDFAELDFKRSP